MAQGIHNLEHSTNYPKAVGNIAVLAAGTAAAVSVIAAKTSYTLYILKIVISVTTTAAQTVTLQDSAGTPVVVAGLAASPALNCFTWDFGPEGLPLTADTGLTYSLSAAGLALRIHVEGYYKQTAAISAATLATA